MPLNQQKGCFMKIRSIIKGVTGPLRNRRGFSFVEVIVTVVIFAVIMAAVSTVLLVGDSSFQTNSVYVELQQELRKSMDWMKDDFRQTGSVAITDGLAYDTWYTTITFHKVDGISGGKISWSDNTTQFVLGGSGSNQLQKIIRDDLGVLVSTTILAQNIESVQFRRQSSSPNVMEVALQAQKDTDKGKTLTTTLDFKIKLRN